MDEDKKNKVWPDEKLLAERALFEQKINDKHLPEYHPKGWGYELWITNNNKYCGKLLFFLKGRSCSYHYHNEKDEVFFIQSGKILLETSGYDDYPTPFSIILEKGDCYWIRPGLRHKMTAIENTELFEFSTPHKEEDSIRVIKRRLSHRSLR